MAFDDSRHTLPSRELRDEVDGQHDHNVEITFPDDLRSPSPTASSSRSRSASPASRKGKERQVLWKDPADQAIAVDLLKDKRMRKLARGKGGVDAEAVVTGRELEQRLREQ